MTPALLLVALSGATAPIPPEPVCFATTVDAGLYAGSYGEPMVEAEQYAPGKYRFLFADADSWTEVIGVKGRFCIIGFGPVASEETH